MEKYKLLVLVIWAVSGVICANAYDEVKIQTIIRALPVTERSSFLRYALNQGYELTEGLKNEVYEKVSPEIFMGLYQYFTDNFLITDVTKLDNLMGVICFPTGCIEIDDPGVHPFLEG